jgi:cell pole-organizing protein PopZ
MCNFFICGHGGKLFLTACIFYYTCYSYKNFLIFIFRVGGIPNTRMKEQHQDIASSASDISPPSLEQILQTIRGVISEGEHAAASDDILLLTSMLKDDGSVENIHPAATVSVRYNAFPVPNTPSPAASPSAYTDIYSRTEQSSPASQGTNSLLSEETAAASTKALNDLLQAAATTKASQDTPNTPPFRSGHTLEDLVIELLKPQLSLWLDRHLPALIEQLVAKEIQKLLPSHKSEKHQG